MASVFRQASNYHALGEGDEVIEMGEISPDDQLNTSQADPQRTSQSSNSPRPSVLPAQVSFVQSLPNRFVSPLSESARQRRSEMDIVPTGTGAWTPGGNNPSDIEEAQLLLDLARLLAVYGAPLYRVEHRFKQSAMALDIPVTIFPLPRNLMINIGDGGSKHPSRTLFIAITPAFDMYKLFQTDKVAKRLSKVNIQFETIKLKAQKAARRRMPYSLSRGQESVVSLMSEPQEIRETITELKMIEMSTGIYPWYVNLLCMSICSSCLCLLFQRGTAADGLMAFLLGGLAAGLQMIADIYSANEIMAIFVSMFVSFLSVVLSHKNIWGSVTGTGYGLCSSNVAISAVYQYMPGFQFTLSMLELTDNHAVASAVRMFTSFIRSLLVGYGLSFGSQFGIRVLQLLDAWNLDDATKSCPVTTAFDVQQLWRILFFPPMCIAILITLRSHYSQWPAMIISGTTGYLVSTLFSAFLNNDMAAALSSFAIGLISNSWARYHDEIAISSVLAGIIWLVPGSLGVRGAVAILTQSDSALGGNAYGFTIITRALSIAIGLLVANAVVFPMTATKVADENDAMLL